MFHVFSYTHLSTFSQDERIVRGDYRCPDSPWTECNEECEQSRTIGQLGLACAKKKETRNCYTAACETKAGDYLVFIDLKVKRLSPGLIPLTLSLPFSFSHS